VAGVSVYSLTVVRCLYFLDECGLSYIKKGLCGRSVFLAKHFTWKVFPGAVDLFKKAIWTTSFLGDNRCQPAILPV